MWLCVQGPYSHPTDFILITYISELFQTFAKYNSVWLWVQGPYSHLTDFTLVSYCTSVSYFRLLISIILCDCVCRGHTAIPQISLSAVTLVSYLRLLISKILCDCVCKGHTTISQISLKSVTSVSYLSIGQLIMFDNTRFKFNLDSFFLPSKLFSWSILLLLVV